MAFQTTGFPFYRTKGSTRSKRHSIRESGESSLSRWLRELKGGSENSKHRPLDRSNPLYHSEGKGLRPKRRDARRLSFNEHATPKPRRSKHRSHGEGPGSQTIKGQQEMSAAPTATASIYSILHSTSGLNFAPGCGAPVRDSASLKGVRYGPGHEKFPSWPGEADSHTGAPHGGSTRSKSWTDHTNYPKEKNPPVVRPFMKRPNSAFTQQLKTVMERCEKIPPETFEGRQPPGDNLYLPRLDRDGKVLGDSDYSVPSPPERDLTGFNKPQLTQADLEEYAKSYQDPQFTHVGSEGQLTRAELEQYTRAYEDSSLRPIHQTQASYAQSEGYHSYVSSTDSTTTTPFLDRLRRDSDAVGGSNRHGSDESRVGRESSASSGSSSETLKWHGSLSDVSSLSSSSNTQNPPPSGLIAHSSRVPPPQRHHSESVLYLGAPPWVQRNNQINNQMRRLFPVSTYTVQPTEQTSPRSPPALSVAERISELEKQQHLQQQQQQQQQLQQSSMRLNCLENDKRTRVTDHASLKAIQKKALLSFYERHHSTWKSEPQLGPQVPPPQPPPRPHPPSHASRRSSSASDYAGAAWREMAGINKDGQSDTSVGRDIRHQHSSSCGSLSTAVLGPLIVGPSISVDDWVPARPPKKPHLRAAYPPPRPPSPDLPPPSPPPVVEDEVFVSDEPLPPPPSEDQLPEWINRQQISPVKQYQSTARSQTNLSTKQSLSSSYIHDRSSMNTSASLDSLNRTDFKYNTHFSPDRLINMSLPDKSSINNSNVHYENQSEMLRHCTINNSSSTESNNKMLRDRDAYFDNQIDKRHSSELLRINDHEKLRNNNLISMNSRQDNNMEHYRNGLDVRIQDCLKISEDSKNINNNHNHGRKISHDDGRKASDSLLMTPRLSESWRTYDNSVDQQPRSLDSNLSINESRYETNHSKPGPQTPLEKKVTSGSITKQISYNSDYNINGKQSCSESKSTYRFHRDNNIVRSSIRKDNHHHHHQNSEMNSSSASFASIKNIFQRGSERQSLQFTTQKLLVNGKIANAVQNGTVSPTRKCAPISQFQRSSVRRNGLEISNSSDEKEERNGKMPLTLPPQCPPTSHQLSQSKASYLAYRGREPRERERGLPNFEGSYKRTMSPSGGQLTIENQEPVKEKSPPPTVPVSVTPVVPVKEIISDDKQPLPETKKAPSQENLVNLQTPASCDKTETSKTLPRNYSLSIAMKRPSRTPRTHSDPVNAVSRECANNNNNNIINSNNNCDTNNHRIESLKKSPVEELKKEEQKSVIISRVPSPTVSVATSTDETSENNNTETIINSNSCTSINNNSNNNFSSGISCNNINNSNNSEDRTVNNCNQEPLRLVQRSEVTLRVNATSDAASQTEATTRTPSPQATILRHPLQEEIECDQLSRDLASQLSPSHRLQGILAPGPEIKRCTDYVSGLFRLDVTPRSRTSLASTVAIPSDNSSSNSSNNNDVENSNIKEKESNSVQSLSANSAYFTTSECKAKLLTLCNRSQPESLSTIGPIDNLHQKKEELMTRLSRKLCVLRAEAVAVAEESRVNETLGETVTNRISSLARPHEAAKLRLHVKEVGHITSLLLGLSGRLARAENALLGMTEEDNDRKVMEEKRDKLRAQLEEAKQLKVSIDRRSGSVSTMLYKYLSAEEYADYDHFINMKAKLLIDSREITDKIQLGEEQLAALQETLNEQSTSR